MIKLKAILYFSLLFTFYFSLSSCSGSSCAEETNIPADIMEKGNQFIISKTGEEFFNKYIKPDLTKSKELSTGYFLAYNLFIPEKSFVNGTIRFTVDSVGKVITDKEVAGIPNCTQSPKDCSFLIDEEMAVKIAKDNKLDEGIKEWRKSFIWSSTYDQYVWQIMSTLKESVGEFGYRGHGKEIIIDPASGKVLAIDEWRIN